jgi:hypothetical protein
MEDAEGDDARDLARRFQRRRIADRVSRMSAQNAVSTHARS